jgi:hypothetical protein
MSERMISRIGWFASAMGICMFFSFVDQIRLNLQGQPGSVILPLATMLNCTAWTVYGSLKATKDWPLICSNGLGVLFAVITAVTAVLASLGEMV